MPSVFLSADQKRFLECVSRLAYCNPFTSERVKLEREALGDAYDASDLAWNLDPRSEDRHRNVARLLSEVEAVLKASQPLFLDGAGTPSERSLYADAVFFLIYHQLDGALDKLIAQAHAEGIGRRRVSVYSDFMERYGHWFGSEQPIDPAHLFACFFQIRRAFHHIFRFFVGRSAVATHLRARIYQSIFTRDLGRYQRVLYQRMRQIPTLITGPSGSGKEVVARAIGLSQYIPFDSRERVFVEDFTERFYAVNLSALSPTLIESELFGHRRGAFTGALQDREGFFAACGPHGTVFLDEIGETDLGIQVKLLRVLQTRQFQRLGDVRSEPFLGKIVAATNLELPEAIAKGTFRDDFYYRLRADTVETPDLASLIGADREELSFLGRYVAAREAGEAEAAVLSAGFDDWCRSHPEYRWPGNFRELEQAMRSLMVHGNYEPTLLSRGGGSSLAASLASSGWTLRELNHHYVRELYLRWPNLEELSRRLQVDRRTVKKHLEATESKN